VCIIAVCVNEAGDSPCEMKAIQGECVSNAVWMYRNCWKSCIGCQAPTGQFHILPNSSANSFRSTAHPRNRLAQWPYARFPKASFSRLRLFLPTAASSPRTLEGGER